MKLELNHIFEKLLVMYGSYAASASALGYTPRHYRELRLRAENGQLINPRIESNIRSRYQNLKTLYRRRKG